MDVILDADGVVFEWMPHILRSVGSSIDWASVRTYDVLGLLDNWKAQQARTLLAEPSWWSQVPLIYGAQQGVQALRSAGHSILWATSPWIDCYGWESVRRARLMKEFESNHDEIMMGAPKHRIMGDILIEDNVENAVRWAARNENGLPLLFIQPYNEGATNRIPRIDWSDVISAGGRFHIGGGENSRP